ncbi:hypothetical protein ABDD95_19375 [Mucilaginibacter sp. PAMB04274]|uniref:hypothetical protein n=1 Tax=Mucilaginibacter sp. PAMB04274 TaxID=3138568 RepID=UPI0031F68297
MSDIKSLADQLRSKVGQPAEKEAATKTGKTVTNGEIEQSARAASASKTQAILALIRAYDNSDHKSMVHVRFDAKTLQTMNHFKMATGVDVTKLVAYAVSELFALHPELKTIIKQFIQKLDS